MATPDTVRALNFGVILFPGFQAIDVFGPLNALNTLASTSPHPLTLTLIAHTLDPISTKPPSPLSYPSLAFGESIIPTHTYDTAPRLDVLIRMRDLASPHIPGAIAFMKKVYPQLKYPGILDGKRATTNKRAWA